MDPHKMSDINGVNHLHYKLLESVKEASRDKTLQEMVALNLSVLSDNKGHLNVYAHRAACMALGLHEGKEPISVADDLKPLLPALQHAEKVLSETVMLFSEDEIDAILEAHEKVEKTMNGDPNFVFEDGKFYPIDMDVGFDYDADKGIKLRNRNIDKQTAIESLQALIACYYAVMDELNHIAYRYSYMKGNEEFSNWYGESSKVCPPRLWIKEVVDCAGAPDRILSGLKDILKHLPE